MKTTITAILTLFLITLSYAPQGYGQAAKASALSFRKAADLTALQPFVPIVEKGNPEDVRLPVYSSHDWTDQYRETGLTFLEYITSNPRRPTARQRIIYIAPLDGFNDSRTVEDLREFVSAYFSLPTRILEGLEMPEASYRSDRGQYDADTALLLLQNKIPDDALLCLTITPADIFSGRLSCVYGLAYSDLRTAMVSTRRIWTSPRSTRSTRERFRLGKLAVHELTHSFGLPHCSAHRCRMNGTTGLGDLDSAPLTLCAPCLKKLQWAISFDKLTRYQRLYRIASQMRHPESLKGLAARMDRLRRTELRRESLERLNLMAARPLTEDD